MLLSARFHIKCLTQSAHLERWTLYCTFSQREIYLCTWPKCKLSNTSRSVYDTGSVDRETWETWLAQALAFATLRHETAYLSRLHGYEVWIFQKLRYFLMGLVGFTSPWEDSRNKFSCVNSKAEKWNGVAATLAFESAQQVTASSHPIFRRTACTCSRHQRSSKGW